MKKKNFTEHHFCKCLYPHNHVKTITVSTIMITSILHVMGQRDIPLESQVYQWYIGTGWTHRIAVWALRDRETSHGSPRCTNGTLGRDGLIGLQCWPYGTEKHPMEVPGVPSVDHDMGHALGQDTCYMGQRDIPREFLCE